jgi:membrane protease YdiL (CAAX protease family)
VSLTLAASHPAAARRELLVVWAKCIAGLAIAKAVSLVEPSGQLAANLAGVAAFLFIFLPDRLLRERGESWAAFGLPWWGLKDVRTWKAWAKGAGIGLLVCALVFPAFYFAYGAFVELLPRLPPKMAAWLAPYAGQPHFRLRFPDRFWLLAINQVLVIALPEELFYRGWMQTTWRATAPERRFRLLGASLGSGFLATQVLFAAGHLVVFEVWRLGTFFPGLLFGWLRERTGNLAAGVVVHALSNLFMATLEASFFR